MVLLEETLVEVYKKWVSDGGGAKWLGENPKDCEGDYPNFPANDVDGLGEDDLKKIRKFMQKQLAEPRECATVACRTEGLDAFQRKGDKLDDPIICETYVKDKEVYRYETHQEMMKRIERADEKGGKVERTARWLGFTQGKEFVYKQKYYQFQQTFTLLFKMPDGTSYLEQRQQVIKTGIEAPQDLCDGAEVQNSKRRAYLTAKHHHHAHIAAINPKHKAHETIKPAIDSLSHPDFGVWEATASGQDSSIAIPRKKTHEEKTKDQSGRLRRSPNIYKIIDSPIHHGDSEGYLRKTWQKVDGVALKQLMEQDPSKVILGSRLFESELDGMIVKDITLEAIKRIDAKKAEDLAETIEDERKSLSIEDDQQKQDFVRNYLKKTLRDHKMKKRDFDSSEGRQGLLETPSKKEIDEFQLALNSYKEETGNLEKRAQLERAHERIVRFCKSVKSMEKNLQSLKESSERIQVLLDIPGSDPEDEKVQSFRASLEAELHEQGMDPGALLTLNLTEKVKENLQKSLNNGQITLNNFKPLMAALDGQMTEADRLLHRVPPVSLRK